MANFEGIAQDFSRENSRTNFREAYRQYHPNDSSLSARSQNQSHPNTGRRVSVDVSDVTPREVITSTDSFTKKQQQQQQQQQHKLSADDDDNHNEKQHSINNLAQPDDDHQKNTHHDNSNSGSDDNNNNNGETSSAPENPYLLRTDCQQFLLVLFLVINIVFGGGLWIAVQSYYGPLEDRGFCSAKCNNNHTSSSSSSTTCNAQRQCLAQPVNLGMSLLNLLGVVFGALGDILGGVTGFILGNIICIFGPMLFAIDVEEGTGYSIAVPLCAVGCALSFFAVLSQLIPKYMNPERIGLSCSTFTSFWDTAIAVAPIIGIMMSSTNLTIFQIFIIVGAVSIPSTIAVLCLVHNHSRVLAKEEYDRSNSTTNVSLLTSNNDHSNNDNNNYGTVSSTTSDNHDNNKNDNKKNEPEAEAEQQQQPQKESFFRVARRVIANWRFVALTCGASSTVTYGYFIMTNLGLLVSSHGAEVSETHDFERDASIIMGILGGATGLFIGKLIDAANWRFRCRVIAVVQTVMLGVTGVLVAVESIPWKLQYLTFVIITFWRMFGFAGINSSFNKAMFEAGDGAAAGVGLGLIYSIAGGISLIVGRFGTELAHHGHFQEVHLILIIVCAICHLIQAAFGY